MKALITTLLLCGYVADQHRFDTAVSLLALELHSHNDATANIKAMCDYIIMGNTDVKRQVLASLEEHYSWA